MNLRLCRKRSVGQVSIPARGPLEQRKGVQLNALTKIEEITLVKWKGIIINHEI